MELTLSKEGTYADRFNTCIRWIKDNVDFDVVPDNHMVVGECMVKHTLTYDFDKHPPFIGFELINLETMEMLHHADKERVFNKAGIPMVELVSRYKVMDLPELSEELIPKSAYGPVKAEGIVFKNYETNQTAKLVSERFQEKNKEKFGGSKKHAKNDTQRVVLEYCKTPRIEKKIFQLMNEQGYDLSMRMMGDLVKAVYDDIWEEEWKEIVSSQYTINFKEMRKRIGKRCAHVVEQMMLDNQNL